MSANVSAPTDVEPGTLVNMVGFGWGAADTYPQFYQNAGSGTATATPLSTLGAVPTADNSAMYTVIIFCKPNDTVVYYQITNEITAVTVSGSVNTNLPVNTTALSPRAYMSVGGTSSVIGISLINLYVEADT